MATCTFFGHKDSPNEIEPILQSALINLVENKNVDLFYVGNQGKFDFMVRKTLKRLKLIYPHINYAVVLAYMPSKKEVNSAIDYSDTIYPENIENTHPRYAIDKRNRWMISVSNFAIVYVKHSGGSAKFKEIAEKKGLIVYNIAHNANFTNKVDKL